MAEPELDFANWRVAEQAMTTAELEFPPVKYEPEVIRIPQPDRVASDYIPRTPNFVSPDWQGVAPDTSAKTWVSPDTAGPKSTFPQFSAPKSLHVPFKMPELPKELAPIVTPSFDWGHAASGILSSIASVSSMMSYVPSLLGAFAGGFGILKLAQSITSTPAQPRTRQAGTWIYFSVPWIKSAPFVRFLEDNKVVIDNVHQVEDKCYIAVAAYHSRLFQRKAQEYKIEYKRVD